MQVSDAQEHQTLPHSSPARMARRALPHARTQRLLQYAAHRSMLGVVTPPVRNQALDSTQGRCSEAGQRGDRGHFQDAGCNRDGISAPQGFGGRQSVAPAFLNDMRLQEPCGGGRWTVSHARLQEQPRAIEEKRLPMTMRVGVPIELPTCAGRSGPAAWSTPCAGHLMHMAQS